MRVNEKIVGEPDEFIRQNLGIVWTAVNRYKNWLKKVVGVDEDDLYSVGCMGLMKAYEQYNPDKGASFYTYSYQRICSDINRFIYNHNDTITFPRKAREVYFKLFRNDMLDKSPEEIADVLHMSKKDINIGLEYAKYSFISMNTPIVSGFKDEEGAAFEDMLFINDDLYSNIHIKEIFDLMDDRDKNILDMLYYKNMSRKEIAKTIGLSATHVNRLVKNISNIINTYNNAI